LSEPVRVAPAALLRWPWRPQAAYDGRCSLNVQPRLDAASHF
jgi:hypothetical protein